MKRCLGSLVLILLSSVCAGARSENPDTSLPTSEISYPGASLSRPFTAREPYVINVMDVETLVPLYRAPRTFDFSGDVPFINSKTHAADPGMFQAWDPSLGAARNLLGKDMTNAGLPGSVEKRNSMTMIRYTAGNGITAGKCRTQLNSYPIPPRTHVRWELEVAFGADDGENDWVLTPPMQSRVLFWQVRSSTGTNPSMSAVVDTDPDDPTKSLVISFFRKGGRATNIQLVGRVHGIPRYRQIPIVIEAFLDERETTNGGKGQMRIWVEGRPISNVVGPTLSWGPGKHSWSLDMYLFNEPKPYAHTRASFWKTARMFVYP